MKHGHFLKAIWLVPLVIALAAIHGFFLYRASSQAVWTVAVGVLALALLIHLGVFGSIFAILRRHPRRDQ